MMDKPQKIAVIGGGSWATAIIKMLQHHVDNIYWYIRNSDSIEFIQKFNHNPRYLSSVFIDPKRVIPSCDLNEVISSADILIFVVPSAFLTNALADFRGNMTGKYIISAIKGVVPGNNQIIGEYFHSEYGVPLDHIGVISGPCHAEEVALERLSYLTIASQNIELAQAVSSVLECRYIKTTVSDDIYGTEYSAVLKNIFAIASGVCNSLGYGDNFQAVLVANALQEIKRFVDTVHPISRDINDSAYLGDLLVTAYSQFSRNRTFGAMIGKGYSVKAAQLEMNMVAEGYYAARCIHEVKKKYDVCMPICDAIYNILYDRVSPSLEISILTEKLR
jgi:glycerol-3-phosphate dehydrogenase (NAD(P)+)